MSFDYSSLPKLPDTQETYNQRMAELRKIVKEDKLDENLVNLFKSVLGSKFSPNDCQLGYLRSEFAVKIDLKREGELKNAQEELDFIKKEAYNSIRKLRLLQRLSAIEKIDISKATQPEIEEVETLVNIVRHHVSAKTHELFLGKAREEVIDRIKIIAVKTGLKINGLEIKRGD